MGKSQPDLAGTPSRDTAAGRDRDEPVHAITTRRSFFFLGALAAGALVPGGARAQRPVPRRDADRADAFGAITPEAGATAPASWTSPTGRLVRRITMGMTGGAMASARTLGYQDYLHTQLQHTRIHDGAVAQFVAARWPLLSQTPEQLVGENLAIVRRQLQEATIFRAAFSTRQLYERMVEFWSDHFNISFDTVGYLKAIDDREVIRAHALGRFPDLLRASAKSPAMLAYLDQTRSRVGRPNENYARELMELHTLGVDGGYTQQDVAELARVLTGWTIRGRGHFYFDPTGHDWGAKTVMGMYIPAGSPGVGSNGVKEGDAVIEMLINHPSTARFIASKMLRWLLTPEPTESQVKAIASVYRSTGGDIRSMVRAILNDAWLPAAPAKLKRPFHYLVSALRAVNAAVSSTTTMNTQLYSLGQPIFIWDTPDGYPDMAEYWAGNILPRWTFASVLASSTGGSVSVNVVPYMAGTPDAAIDMMDEEFFGGEMSPASRSALLGYLRGGAFTQVRVRETIALALGSHDFQWY